jgi:hypothetical protein
MAHTSTEFCHDPISDRLGIGNVNLTTKEQDTPVSMRRPQLGARATGPFGHGTHRFSKSYEKSGFS